MTINCSVCKENLLWFGVGVATCFVNHPVYEDLNRVNEELNLG